MCPESETPLEEGYVLVIDDDKDICDAITDALALFGIRTESARDGQQALDRLRSGPPPSVIMLDLMMPVMDGWQFRAAQVADPALASIPVVILSGQGRMLEHAAKLNAKEVLLKPIDLQELLAVVRPHLPAQRREPSSL
jgi:CheY-like chemotaxis protein